MLLAVFTSNAIANLAIWIIIIVAIVALTLIFLKVALGWQPPPWFWQVVGIVAAALIIIFFIVLLVHVANAPGPLFG